MEILSAIGAALALLAFIPLFLDIERGGIRLNIATWLIWTAVDIILLLAISSAHGSALLLASAFVFGDIVMVCLVLSTGKWQWRQFETVIAIAAALALGIWWLMGAQSALITIVLVKYFIGMVPSLKDAAENPERKQVFPWLLFTFGILCNVISAGAWSMAGSFYPSVAFVMNGTLAILHTRDRKQG